MSKDIRIKKGLSIKLKGRAADTLAVMPHSGIFAVKPTDFHGVTPKMVVKVGDSVASGDVLFFSKSQEEIKFVSPVAGKVVEIQRGAKRRILAVKVQASGEESKDFGIKNPDSLNRLDVLNAILEGGLFPFINQRPYDVMADPKEMPKAIFVSGFDTAPLAVDYTFILKGKEAEFQAGLTALSKLTEGAVNLGVNKDCSSFYNQFSGVEKTSFSGVHPAGNVGVQIGALNPINAGERVWTVNAQDVAAIGTFFLTGKYPSSKIVALVGSSVVNPQYYQIQRGQEISVVVKNNLNKDQDLRFINGNVLTGMLSSESDFVGALTNEISVIPEGNTYRAFGWLPFVQNFVHSSSRTSLSWLSGSKEYELSANMNGEIRALVETGKMEEVVPLDVFPMQLLKAIMEGDIEKMENLGIYEVAPEDFALVDYTSSSKIEAQQIVRQGLDLMIKEVG
jgi:Na+-transporting NADH:ubiquinone oxidoreductase subunit A